MPETVSIEMVNNCEGVRRLYEDASMELDFERARRRAARRRLESCQKCLGYSASLASIFAVVSVILWLRGGFMTLPEICVAVLFVAAMGWPLSTVIKGVPPGQSDPGNGGGLC